MKTTHDYLKFLASLPGVKVDFVVPAAEAANQIANEVEQVVEVVVDSAAEMAYKVEELEQPEQPNEEAPAEDTDE